MTEPLTDLERRTALFALWEYRADVAASHAEADELDTDGLTRAMRVLDVIDETARKLGGDPTAAYGAV